MEQNQKRGVKFALLFAIAMISMASFASALGLSMGPSRDNPLRLSPGESLNFPVNLQNGMSDDEVTVKLSISQGNEIASTSSADYVLKARSSDTYAAVSVRLPSNAVVGSEYMVTLSLATMGKSAAGQMISLGSAMDVSFPVKVIQKPVEKKEEQRLAMTNKLVLVIAAIAIIAILWILLSLLKKKKK